MKIDSLTANTQKLSKTQELTSKSGDFQKMVTEVQEKKDETQLKEACQQIEALFIHQLISQMRKGVPQNGLLPPSTATKIYRDMLDTEYSKEMAKSPDNLGLAAMLYKDLTSKWKVDSPEIDVKE